VAEHETTLTASGLRQVRSQVRRANAATARWHPGDSGRRQPVHVVYGGAHLFHPDTVKKVGRIALERFQALCPDADALAQALELAPELARQVHPRVLEKLRREPVEDYRIDFEDGYGPRPNAEEDDHAVQAARALAQAQAEGGLPPFVGIRIKSFSRQGFERGVRTLDLFLTAYVQAAGGAGLPEHFVVTLPKVTSREQVAALAQVLLLLERRLALHRRIPLELMVETPESLVGPDGAWALPSLLSAADRRCRGAHFGTYDFTAACDVTAAHQTMDHPAADFARHMMQVSLAGTGVWRSDGATTVMPVGPHRPGPDGKRSASQEAENRAAVLSAWRLSHRDIRRSLRQGFYQGWDLHPAQIPVRYAAVHGFFLEGLADATARLGAFVKKAAQATLLGGVFDDAATGQGLLNFFLRGLACGAISEDELAATGLSPEELRTRSFDAILAGRHSSPS
jgi:citrate lyase beta subunit